MIRNKKRKHRVAVRLKVKRRSRKNFALMAGLMLCLGAGVYVSGSLWHRVSSVNFNSIFARKISSVEISGVSEPLKSGILELVDVNRGRIWAKKDSERTADLIRQKYVWLEDVRVRQGIMGGRLKITALMKKAVAMTGNGQYLSDKGDIFSAPPEFYGNDYISLDAADCRSGDYPQMAGFIRDMTRLKKNLPSGVSGIMCSGKTESAVVRLEDGSEITWGDYSFTDEKIRRLGQVIADAASKSGGPVRADLRYFSDGKILLSRFYP